MAISINLCKLSMAHGDTNNWDNKESQGVEDAERKPIIYRIPVMPICNSC